MSYNMYAIRIGEWVKIREGPSPPVIVWDEAEVEIKGKEVRNYNDRMGFIRSRVINVNKKLKLKGLTFKGGRHKFTMSFMQFLRVTDRVLKKDEVILLPSNVAQKIKTYMKETR